MCVWVAGIVQGMARYQHNSTVQVCNSVRLYTKKGRGRVLTFTQLPVLKNSFCGFLSNIALDFQSTFATNFNSTLLQEHSCGFLSNVAVGSSSSVKGRLVSSGAVDAILGAMDAHPVSV